MLLFTGKSENYSTEPKYKIKKKIVQDVKRENYAFYMFNGNVLQKILLQN